MNYTTTGKSPGPTNRSYPFTLLFVVAVALVGMVLRHSLTVARAGVAIDMVPAAVIDGIAVLLLAKMLVARTPGTERSRRQAVQRLEQLTRQIEIANQLGERILSMKAIDNHLVEVIALIRERFGYHHVHIFLIDETQNEMVLYCDMCKSRAGIDEEGGFGGGAGYEDLVRQAARTGRPLVGSGGWREWLQGASDLVAEVRAELAVPLQAGDRIVGVLYVTSGSSVPFDDTDIKVLQLLSGHIAVAIEMARLSPHTKQRFDAMMALHETSVDIVSELDIQQVMQRILQRSASLLGAQAALLGIYEPENNLVRMVAAHNLPSQYQVSTLPIGTGIAGRVMQTGKALVVNDYLTWEGRSELFEELLYDAVMGVPLRSREGVVGCLEVLDHGKRRPFAEKDVWLLSSFADLACIALKNAELYSEIKTLNEELEQRVASRTEQLAAAQAKLAQKADELQALLQVTIRLQEEERARIARDMHDSVTQLLLGAVYAAQAAKEALNNHVLVPKEHLDTIQQILHQIEREIRETIYDLRPVVLDAEGIGPALKQYIDKYSKRLQIPCTLRITGSPVRLPQEIEIAIYRIVQEALQNVASHASADSVSVAIQYKSHAVCVVVRDDGCGFAPDQKASHVTGRIGLAGMRERAENIGARLQIKSTLGQGTRVTLHVPIPVEKEATR